jgi:putative transcriptional regulator
LKRSKDLDVRNRLKIERAEFDLTQEQLAKKIGVYRQTINSIEKIDMFPQQYLL